MFALFVVDPGKFFRVFHESHPYAQSQLQHHPQSLFVSVIIN